MSSQSPQAALVPPDVNPPPNERRSRTRYPISVPFVVRLRGPGVVPAPSRILDISEDGIGLEMPIALPPERTLALDLDLQTGLSSENCGQQRVRLIGQVAWSLPNGRAGVRFFSPDHAALQAIQQWLFLNALAGAASTSSLPELLPLAQEAARAAHAPVPERFPDEDAGFGGDSSEPALSPLERDINAIVSRALAQTGAKGAALALYEGGQLICRATCGTDTPALGAPISTDSGITGECIRFGQVMYCSDAASDPRVNHEICGDLGVRSILALPLFAGQRVAGLLEVLSQRADAFAPGDAMALDMVARPVIGLLFAEGKSEALHRGVRDIEGMAVVEPPVQELDLAAIERRREALAQSLRPRTRLFRGLLAAAASVAVVGAVGWLVISQSRTLASLGQSSVVASTTIPAEVPHLPPASSTATIPDPAPTLDELKSAAQAGDAAAQYAMGAHYATGEGVNQDYATAARWFTLAAKKGDARAQGMLGAYYWSGRGVRKDLKQAYFWSVLARDGNDEISKDRVDSLVAQLDRTQMLEVQQLVREWYRKRGAAASTPAAVNVSSVVGPSATAVR